MFFLKVSQFLVLMLVMSLSLPVLALKQGELNIADIFDNLMSECQLTRDLEPSKTVRRFVIAMGDVSVSEAEEKMTKEQIKYMDNVVYRCRTESSFIRRANVCPNLARNPNYATIITRAESKMKSGMKEEDVWPFLARLFIDFFSQCDNEYAQQKVKKQTQQKPAAKTAVQEFDEAMSVCPVTDNQEYPSIPQIRAYLRTVAAGVSLAEAAAQISGVQKGLVIATISQCTDEAMFWKKKSLCPKVANDPAPMRNGYLWGDIENKLRNSRPGDDNTARMQLGLVKMNFVPFCKKETEESRKR